VKSDAIGPVRGELGVGSLEFGWLACWGNGIGPLERAMVQEIALRALGLGQSLSDSSAFASGPHASASCARVQKTGWEFKNAWCGAAD